MHLKSRVSIYICTLAKLISCWNNIYYHCTQKNVLKKQKIDGMQYRFKMSYAPYLCNPLFLNFQFHENTNSSNKLNIQQLIPHLVHIIWLFYSLFPLYHFISYHYAVKYTHRILISMLMNIFTIKSTRRNRQFFSSCVFLQLQSNATKLRY